MLFHDTSTYTCIQPHPCTPYCVLLQDFSEWSQCQVLELAGSYVPASEDEVYVMLNAMEDRLFAANSAVCLAAIKAFLHLTLQMPATHQQVGDSRAQHRFVLNVACEREVIITFSMHHDLLSVHDLSFHECHVNLVCDHERWEFGMRRCSCCLLGTAPDTLHVAVPRADPDHCSGPASCTHMMMSQYNTRGT